ncbi:MBL fold metallo-hydrolase [Actinoalloteichus spitiensis]|uniref:MBL fold metallo-hydrolase n=1 Tax=Actinoalloteichus spitiensis TaxID=252394 RepID=UPI00036BC003|nr:MBL fold metallo-hydrolase [Actinoalloteichus spitiensis]
MISGRDGDAASGAGHPAYGRRRAVADVASVWLANNPSAMTLEGTNTWVLRAPGARSCVVVDPGPADEEHLRRVGEESPVDLVLLTHGHHDHSAGLPRFAELVGAPTAAIDPRWSSGEPLVDGAVLDVAGLRLEVLHTPGHTDDSACFLVHGGEGAVVLAGDTVLGRGTTVLTGSLRDYLTTLRRLAGLPPGTPLLPGHGAELPDAAATARAYLEHRERRLDQVRAALTQLGATATPAEVVAHVYPDLDPALSFAAEQSVRAQLRYLAEDG